ncbi:hypothetical protein DYU05_04135 [Mucilaginibacter terrenus]|uniref:Uncharacterized protein n=1 Tax=Mucilaginibacter terrenus TaxID=2482727 RepID=A0A3E2NUX5_9SPHI|nr:hypothetical protein DYU05_04135 [Mucilaginibacter terrenus]
MIEIAVDGRPLQGPLSGVGKYVWQVIVNILKVTSNVTSIIYTNRLLLFPITESRVKVYIDSRYQNMKPLIWRKFFLSRIIKKNPPAFTFFGGTFTTFKKLPGKSIVIALIIKRIMQRD